MAQVAKLEVDLRSSLAAAKEFSPKLATNLRRELRGTGDDIIAAQKALLSAPLPSGTEAAGQRYALGQNKKTGKIGVVRRNVYRDKATGGGASRGMREAIKAGLKTRVVAGQKRQGINIRTTKKSAPLSIVWQSKRFRHKVWGRLPWQLQKGQPYFWQPIRDGYAAAALRAERAIEDAISQIT